MKGLFMNEKKKIEVMELYFIWGRERNRAFKMLMSGKGKQEIKKETVCYRAQSCMDRKRLKQCFCTKF